MPITDRRRNMHGASAGSDTLAAAGATAVGGLLCVLDAQGTVLGTGGAWPLLAAGLGAGVDDAADGANFLDLCARAVGAQTPRAAAFTGHLRQLLKGQVESFSLRYPSPHWQDEPQAEARWFEIKGSRTHGSVPLCVISVLDITGRQQDAQRLLQLDATLQATADAIVVIDRTRQRVANANIAACMLFGRTATQLLQCTPDDLFPIPVPGAAQAALPAGAADSRAFETQIRHADGHWLPVEVQSRFIHAGGASLIVRTVRDTTRRLERQAAMLQLAQRHDMLARLGQFALENPPQDELMTEAAAVIRLGLNVVLCRLLTATPDDRVLLHVAGAGWDDAWLRDPHFDAVVETQDHFALGARESIVVDDFETEVRFTSSPILRAHRVRAAVEVLICGAGGSYGVLGVYAVEPGRFNAADATFMQSVSNTLAAAIERHHADEQLTHMAQFDALTGLPNRSLYLDRLGQSLIDAERDKRSVGVLFIDIDHFKHVNDSWGHAVGDQLLVDIAARLKDAVRASDGVGRLGGDEFTVTLAHLAREDDAANVARKVVAALSAPYRLGEHTAYVTASVGIGIYPVDGTEPEVLLKNADTAMYRAKETGRNGFEFYLPQMNERAEARMRLETDLRGAMGRSELLLHYQPKVSLLTGEISGMEALLRWSPPGRELISPAEFIPLLEETGLIVPVGEWVVATVCAQIKAWQALGLDPPPVAVNLSARQFRQDRLDAVVGGILAAHGVAPGLLELELTESTLMSDSEAAVQALRNMKALGIRLSVDDFGTGYSSLAYLKRFPLNALKIDRAFIRDVTTDPDDATIARAIISLAHSLKLKVVAEGVETRAQLDFLRRHGCDEMQGYYFARPLRVDALTAALRERHRLVLGPLAPEEGQLEG